MTAALETAEECRPATAGEITARKLQQQQAEINKRILDAMSSSDENEDVRYIYDFPRPDGEAPASERANCSPCAGCRERSAESSQLWDLSVPLRSTSHSFMSA